jgi:hypothetical protein
MAKLPLILSIIALLCATALGIAAKGKADQKVRELAVTQSELKKSEATVATRTTELAKANESLAAAGTEIQAKSAEVVKLAKDVKTAKDELEESTDTVKKRDAKLADLEIEVRDAGLKLDAAETAKTTLQTELADAQKQIAESKVAMAALEMRKKVADNNADAPRKAAGPVSASPNLTGSVLAVNEGLNFLVLNVGDRQGVSVNTAMLVVRGGQRVATLKVTSIEPRTSIAEVVPGTMARGQAVQTGDRVVTVHGERKAPGAAPAKAGRSAPGAEPALPEA